MDSHVHRKRPLVLTLLIASLAAAAFLLPGCGAGVSTTGSTTASPTVSTSQGGAVPGETLATTTTTAPPTASPWSSAGSYKAEPAYVESQAVALSAIAGLDKAHLSESAKQVLARQSFVAVARSPEEGPWRFWQVYETARYAGLPILVTTDSILNAYHSLFDTLLQRLEERSLFAQAEVMTKALLEAATQQWGTATEPAVKEAARLNVAFFTVADTLLTGGGNAPGTVKQEVDAEVGLIEAAGGLQRSPIMGYTEDYGQYRPRGHYTRSETLQRYFRTLMWYGHTGFFLNPRAPDLPEETAVSLTRRAALIAASLQGTAREAWAAIYEPTSFLVGRADDLLVDDLQQVLADVYGTATPVPDQLADPAKIATLREALNRLPAPRILSATVRAAGDTEGREENERSFRVMGQRYIPDSYAFQQLVWAYVGEAPDKKRDVPMGLDIMTVLGAPEAYRLAKEEYHQDAFKNWESQLEKVSGEFADPASGLWPANLYSGWLESLQKAMAFPAEQAPAFMRSRAWARKSLNTALGSWTELRHDTILYAKQSVAAEGEGGEEEPVPGYVEPYPAFYAQIAQLATTLRKGLSTYGLGDPETAGKLDAMVELAQTLASIAGKELSGEELTAEERMTVQYYGHYLETLEQFVEEEGRTLQPAAEKSPVVADVHTSTISMTALEEATGYPLTLYAAFDVGGGPQLFAGASYAYHEFTVPLAARMTDEEWIAQLDSGQAPPRPVWTDEWIVQE